MVNFFHLEILCAPSEMPANLPGQFSLSGQIFLHWAAATLKGHVEFQNNFFRPLFTIIFKPKMVISRLKILVTYSSRSRWCDAPYDDLSHIFTIHFSPFWSLCPQPCSACRRLIPKDFSKPIIFNYLSPRASLLTICLLLCKTQQMLSDCHWCEPPRLGQNCVCQVL